MDKANNKVLANKNSPHLSYHTKIQIELTHVIKRNFALAVSKSITVSLNEISKFREGCFSFLSGEYAKSKTVDKSDLENYCKTQMDVFDQLIKDLEQSSFKCINKFNEEFGKN